MKYIVRRQDILHPRGGSSYLVEASKTYGTKYRMAKTAKGKASTFGTRDTAVRWASRVGGEVVKI
jgi:hypothetical protein